MIYCIFFGQDGHKVATPIKSTEEYLRLRGTQKQYSKVQQARLGDEKAKLSLQQVNYSGFYPDGVVKGNKLPNKFFALDIDEEEEFERVKDILLANPQQYGLMMLEQSARKGGHAVCLKTPGLTILECQVRLAQQLDTEMDTQAHDVNRVLFTTTDSPEDLLYLSDDLFRDDWTVEQAQAEAALLEAREKNGEEILPPGAHGKNKHYRVPKDWDPDAPAQVTNISQQVISQEVVKTTDQSDATPSTRDVSALDYKGIPYSEIIDTYWSKYHNGQTPTYGSRNTLTHELATHMRYVCDYDVELMMKVIPNYDDLSDDEKRKCIESAVSGKRTAMSKRMQTVLSHIQQKNAGNLAMSQTLDEAEKSDNLYYYRKLPKLPPAIKASIAAVGEKMAIQALLVIAPIIGALATGVKLVVHNKCKNLNLQTFVCGGFASGKGLFEELIEAWIHFLRKKDDEFLALEDEYKRKKRAAKNKNVQPKEETYPIRLVTMNSTMASLADRLGNLNGIHAFSYTCEADTVSQRWGKLLPELSVMLREAYDGSRYDRAAKSEDAVSVHLLNLLWNTVLCGTPDALYRMYPKSIDGTVSRVMIACTPDNTFEKLEEHVPNLTPDLEQKIHEVAQLLPLMKGVIDSKKLENTGREWLEDIRLESLEENDGIKAKFRMRSCVNTQRVVACLLVVAAASRLIEKHGLEGARQQLEADPECWLPLLPSLMRGKFLSIFNLVADYLLENSLHYFRKKMEEADSELSQIVSGNRQRTGKNDNIYAQLPDVFTFEQAFNIGKNVRGNGYTMNSCQQMIKNWKRQGLIEPIPDNKFRKLNSKTSYSQVG